MTSPFGAYYLRHVEWQGHVDPSRSKGRLWRWPVPMHIDYRNDIQRHNHNAPTYIVQTCTFRVAA